MLEKTHEMYTVLTNPPFDTYSATGRFIKANREGWQPIYRKQSISKPAQMTAQITEWDELHYKLSWNPTVDSIIVLRNDVKHWLDDDSQQWEDGKETHKLILPEIPKLLKDPCLLYTSPSPRDRQKSRMPSSA